MNYKHPPSPTNIRRTELLERFGIVPTIRRKRDLRPSFMDQIDKCKDDSARRLLLGVSK